MVAAASWTGLSVGELTHRWGHPVHLYDRVTSTNTVARTLAAAGAPSGSIVLAGEQTRGRGRDGSRWVSPKGTGVYLSMIVRLPDPRANPLLSLIAGVDVCLALNRGFPGLRAMVKWPNDIYARGRKLGGILAEVIGDARSAPSILGVGINVLANPGLEPLPAAISMMGCGVSASLPEVADLIVSGLGRRIPEAPSSLDEAGLGEFASVDWLRGRSVVHTLPGGKPLPGVAVGINRSGALLLRTMEGDIRRLVTGSVTLDEKARTPGQGAHVYRGENEEHSWY